jgi:L-lactate dehydrogenase (cytochrome)
MRISFHRYASQHAQISNNASCSIEEIMSVKVQDQGIVFQLYMNKDRAASEKLIRSLESRGFKAIMLTVDAAVAGKRELDQRAKGDVGSAVRPSAL